MLLAFRIFHILAGVLWVGAVIFVAMFLMPSLRAAGPAGGPVMSQLTQRKMPIYMMAMAIITILSGTGLIWINSAGYPGSWMQTSMGRTYGWGGLLAILAAIVGMAMSSPAVRKMGAIAQGIAKRGGPPTPEESAEMQRLQGRMALSIKIVSVLVLLATTAMAVARYLP